jgi:nitrate/nitrite transporter NarK
MQISKFITRSRVTSKDAKSNFGFTHWAVIIMLMAFGYLANGSMNDGLNTYVGLFTKKFDWTSGELLTYSTYAGWASIILILGYTQLTLRVGVRKTAIVAISIAATGMFLWGRAQTQGMYFLSILLLVSSSGAIMVIRDTTLNNWFPTKKGLALGWATMGPHLGTATILFLIGWGGKIMGFTGHFDIIVIGFLILLLVLIFWYRDNPEDKGCFPDNDRTMTKEKVMELHNQGKKYIAQSPWTVRKLLRTKQVWQIGIGFGGLNMLIGNAVMSQLIPAYVAKGITTLHAMMLMSGLAILSIFTSYIFGVLDAKFGSRTVTIIFFILGFLSLIFLALPGRWTVYVSSVLIGAFISESGDVMGSMTNTVFGRYDFARVYSVVYPMCVAVRSCSYALIGILRTATGGYTVPYMILMGVAVIGALNAFFIDDRLLGRDFSRE